MFILFLRNPVELLTKMFNFQHYQKLCCNVFQARSKQVAICECKFAKQQKLRAYLFIELYHLDLCLIFFNWRPTNVQKFLVTVKIYHKAVLKIVRVWR